MVGSIRSRRTCFETHVAAHPPGRKPVCMYGWMDGWMYGWTCMHACMYVCMYVYERTYVCVRMYVRMYVYVCTYVCTYVRTYVRMYVCTYINMCVYIYKYIIPLISICQPFLMFTRVHQGVRVFIHSHIGNSCRQAAFPQRQVGR